jgi:nitrite reductase/ring-hydroxylating ferredoxin subunit
MPEFHKIGSVDEVPEGAGREFQAGGKKVAVFNVKGAFHAIPGICPHRGGPLAEGILDGCEVTCPWHAWTFDVTNGNRHGFPEGMGSISTYRVRVEGNEIWVEC